MILLGMEDIETQHETGHICTVCGGDAIEAKATIALRAEGPIVAASVARYRTVLHDNLVPLCAACLVCYRASIVKMMDGSHIRTTLRL